MRSLVTRFVRADEGQDLIEYALLAAFIALVCVGAITTTGTNLNALWTTISGKVSAANTAAGS